MAKKKTTAKGDQQDQAEGQTQATDGERPGDVLIGWRYRVKKKDDVTWATRPCCLAPASEAEAVCKALNDTNTKQGNYVLMSDAPRFANADEVRQKFESEQKAKQRQAVRKLLEKMTSEQRRLIGAPVDMNEITDEQLDSLKIRFGDAKA